MKYMKTIRLLGTALLTVLMGITILACNNDSTDDGNKESEVAVTGNAEPGYDDVVIDGYANLTSVTVNLDKVKMGAEISLDEDFNSSKKEYTKELVGNKLSVKIKRLKSDTKYYYRVFVFAGNVEYYGQTKTFQTKYDDRYVSRLHELLIDSQKLVFDATENLTSVYHFGNEDLSNYYAITYVDWCSVTFDAHASTMTVTVSENNSESPRSTKATLKDREDDAVSRDITISQKNKAGETGLPTLPITIINNTSTSFMPLWIYFRNYIGEVLKTENLGDLHPGESVTASIPEKASTWFLVTTVGSDSYYTSDHLTSETTFTITNELYWYTAN